MSTVSSDSPSIWVTVSVAALAAGVYIAFGGLGAVVANDALQAVLILAGGIVISVLAWQAVPSWDAVVEAAGPGALEFSDNKRIVPQASCRFSNRIDVSSGFDKGLTDGIHAVFHCKF